VLWPQLGQRQGPQPVIANEVGEGLAVPGTGRRPLPQAGQPLFGVLPHGLRCRQAGRARGAAGRSAVPAPGCDAVPRPARRDGRFLRLHAEAPARRAAVAHLPAMPVDREAGADAHSDRAGTGQFVEDFRRDQPVVIDQPGLGPLVEHEDVPASVEVGHERGGVGRCELTAFGAQPVQRSARLRTSRITELPTPCLCRDRSTARGATATTRRSTSVAPSPPASPPRSQPGAPRT
jgi:hypothetical protein